MTDYSISDDHLKYVEDILLTLQVFHGLRSHAEVLNACFNLTKRLILECMRFFECVAHTSSLRVKSEIVDHDAWHIWIGSAEWLKQVEGG